jgi:hypothetical protein
MRESIFLNKNEMVSFYWVDVEIGRGGGDFLYTLENAASHQSIGFHLKGSASERGNRRRIPLPPNIEAKGYN